MRSAFSHVTLRPRLRGRSQVSKGAFKLPNNTKYLLRFAGLSHYNEAVLFTKFQLKFDHWDDSSDEKYLGWEAVSPFPAESKNDYTPNPFSSVVHLTSRSKRPEIRSECSRLKAAPVCEGEEAPRQPKAQLEGLLLSRDKKISSRHLPKKLWSMYLSFLQSNFHTFIQTQGENKIKTWAWGAEMFLGQYASYMSATYFIW